MPHDSWAGERVPSAEDSEEASFWWHARELVGDHAQGCLCFLTGHVDPPPLEAGPEGAAALQAPPARAAGAALAGVHLPARQLQLRRGRGDEVFRAQRDFALQPKAAPEAERARAAAGTAAAPAPSPRCRGGCGVHSGTAACWRTW
eukprot:TRINITY_DN14074_c0_g1_i6.p1 TRINITY_DN14074_c0_g1~~TRINITY_DN14074_c0_g1_i6.p1  ORF type:complete len:146 (+),score=9.26 TRINITY_DN14074_c0_g1_i6:76-513(+)